MEYREHSLTFTSKRRLRESPESRGHRGSLGRRRMRRTVVSLVSSLSLVFIKGGRILILRVHWC